MRRSDDTDELELAELRGAFLTHLGAMHDDEPLQEVVQELAKTWVDLDRALDQVPVEQDLDITKHLVSRIKRVASVRQSHRSETLIDLANDVNRTKDAVLANLAGDPKAPFRPKKLALPGTKDNMQAASALGLEEILSRIHLERG